MIELNANVKFGDGIACFRIQKENAGVYCADLIYFDGKKKLSPPEKITLLRGIRQWAGSYDDVELLNELGKIIEEAYYNPTNASIFK